MIEQESPFELLEGDCQAMAGVGWFVVNGFHEIDERTGVPSLAGQSEDRFVGGITSNHIIRAHRERGIDWVVLASCQPIFAVGKIPLAPVHDGVPEGSSRAVDLLRERVRFIQKIMPEPETRQHGPASLRIKCELVQELINGQRLKESVRNVRTLG